MSEINQLVSRIDAEFSAMEEKFKKFRVQQVQEHQVRQQQLEQLGRVFDQLSEVWRPRLEALARKFGERVKVTPKLMPSTREATFAFQSGLARIELKFAASTDRDVTKVVLTSDLEIRPIMMQFDAHSELEFPLEAVDREAVARWVDDRIVSFVKTYLSLHENEYYLQDYIVEDPIAQVRFPKFAAGATLEWQGRTLYFVGEETCGQFKRENQVAATV